MLTVFLLFAAAAAPPLTFLYPEDLVEVRNVRTVACGPEYQRMLIPKDPARPQRWCMPAATETLGDVTRIWYQRVDKSEKEYFDQRVLCVGELRGGEWSLPSLGDSNIVMRRSPHKPTWGGFNVFQITRVDDGYRMLYWDQPGAEGNSGAMTASSKDGLTWTKEPGTVFTETNDAFSLIRTDKEYFLYQTVLEDWPDKPYADNLDKKKRVISLRRSADLRTWTPPAVFLRPDAQDAPETEFYLMKVFARGEGYLGLIMKYYGDPKQPGKHSVLLKYELVRSKDGIEWTRPWRDTDLGFWSYADPFVSERRLWFAAWKDDGMQLAGYLMNRLVAAQADEAGEFLTREFEGPVAKLKVDADARDGSIEIALTDAAGKLVEPVQTCRCVMEDVESRECKCVAPAGKYRLRVKMDHAKLFAVTPLGE